MVFGLPIRFNDSLFFSGDTDAMLLSVESDCCDSDGCDGVGCESVGVGDDNGCDGVGVGVCDGDVTSCFDDGTIDCWIDETN